MRSRHPLVVVALAILVLAAVTYVVEGPSEMNDLEVFHRAGARFVVGEPLYRAEDGHFEFKYLPIAAALFAPLSRLPVEVAKVGWLAASALALVMAFTLSERLIEPRLPAWVLPVAFVVLGRSIEREFAHGQINALILLLVVGAFVALKSRRDGWAGALIGVAVLLKPPWLVVLPYLLLSRRWRAAATLSLVLVIGIALPVLRYGVVGTATLHAAMAARLAASTARLLTYPTNVSLPGALAKLFGGGASSLALLLLALPCAQFARRVLAARGSLAEHLAFLAPLAITWSPQAWDYTVLTTLPALLLALRRPRAVTCVLALVVALDPVLLFGHAAMYAAVMRWSPNTWFLVWMLWEHCGTTAPSPPNRVTALAS